MFIALFFFIYFKYLHTEINITVLICSVHLFTFVTFCSHQSISLLKKLFPIVRLLVPCSGKTIDQAFYLLWPNCNHSKYYHCVTRWQMIVKHIYRLRVMTEQSGYQIIYSSWKTPATCLKTWWYQTLVRIKQKSKSIALVINLRDAHYFSSSSNPTNNTNETRAGLNNIAVVFFNVAAFWPDKNNCFTNTTCSRFRNSETFSNCGWPCCWSRGETH